MEDNTNKTEPLILARELGLYDKWEYRLETWLYNEAPDLFENKGYIIRSANKARKMASDPSIPFAEHEAHNYIMSGVERTLHGEVMHCILGELDCFDGTLPDPYIRPLGISLCKDERIVSLLESYGGISGLEFDVYKDDEFREQALPKLVTEIISEWGGIEKAFSAPTEEQLEKYNRFRKLFEKDYRTALNELENVKPIYMKLSKLWDGQKEKGEPTAPYFDYLNEHRELEQIPVLPDWAVDRYFGGNPEMKEAFNKYASELDEFYSPFIKAFIDRITEKHKEKLDEIGAYVTHDGYTIRVLQDE